jgi:SprT protein
VIRLNDDLELRITNKVKETIDKINNHFGLDMPVPKIYYDITGTTAGIAKYKTMSIHLNTALLLNNIEDSINVTVPHEVCHLTTFYLHRKESKPGMPKPHGAAWKLMMWVAGASAKVTHDYDISEIKAQKKEYNYKCGCKDGVIVSAVMHGKIKHGNQYKCKKCNKVITNGELICKIGFIEPSPNGTTAIRED